MRRCYDFQQNNCQRENCKFVHEHDIKTNNNRRAEAEDAKNGKRATVEVGGAARTLEPTNAAALRTADGKIPVLVPSDGIEEGGWLHVPSWVLTEINRPAGRKHKVSLM